MERRLGRALGSSYQVVRLIGRGGFASLGIHGQNGQNVVVFGIPAVIVALAILLFVRETGEDRAAAVAHGSVRDAFGTILRDPDHRWIYLASILGGGGRGLGVVNLFVLLYLSGVIRLDEATTGLMYGVLIVFGTVVGGLADAAFPKSYADRLTAQDLNIPSSFPWRTISWQ